MEKCPKWIKEYGWCVVVAVVISAAGVIFYSFNTDEIFIKSIKVLLFTMLIVLFFSILLKPFVNVKVTYFIFFITILIILLVMLKHDVLTTFIKAFYQ